MGGGGQRDGISFGEGHGRIKFEIRSSKFETNSKFEARIAALNGIQNSTLIYWCFGLSNSFRTSTFEFRISFTVMTSENSVAYPCRARASSIRSTRPLCGLERYRPGQTQYWGSRHAKERKHRRNN